MPLPIKSPVNTKSARSFFRKTSRATTRNVMNLTRGARSMAKRRGEVAQQESYLDAVTSMDSQKNASLLQTANKTAEEINLLQQNENKILENILRNIEDASKVEPKEDDKGILKRIEDLFDFLKDRVNRIRNAVRPQARPASQPSPRARAGAAARSIARGAGAAAGSIARGAATGIAAESALSYLTGKDETMSALGLGLSPLATGTLGAVAGIKGAFELAEKYTPESRKGADIRPQDIEKVFAGELNIEFEENVKPFIKGQIVSVNEILKVKEWELDKASKEEQEAFIDSLLKTKKAKPVKEAPQPISNVTDPNLRRVSTSRSSSGSVNVDKIVFDADSIRFLSDDMSFGNERVSGGRRPGFQRIAASTMMQTMPGTTSYSDITPGAVAETTDAFKSPGPDSLGQDQSQAKPATPAGAASITATGALQRNVSVSEMGNAEKVIDFFTKRGYTREQAAGIAANIQHESNFKTDALGDGGKAYGLAQWHPDRQEKFKAAFGKDIRQASFDEQLQFIDWELQGPEKSAGRRLRASSTAAEAAMNFDKFYERSSGTTTNMRMQLAEKYVTGGEAKPTTGSTLSQASVGSEVGDIALKSQTPKVILPQSQAPSAVPQMPMGRTSTSEDPSIRIRLQQTFRT